MTNVRCGLTRIPFEEGDEVLAIPVEKIDGTWTVTELPFTGAIDGSGRVSARDGQSKLYDEAFFVSKAAAESLRTHRFASRVGDSLARVDKALETRLENVRASNDTKIMPLITESALSSLGIPVFLPNLNAGKKSEHKENLEFILAVQKDAGFLRLGEYLGFELGTSEPFLTIMTKSEHNQLQSGLKSAMEHKRTMKLETERFQGMF